MPTKLPFDPSELIAKATDFGGKVLGALILIILTFWVANKVKHLVMTSMKKAKIDSTLSNFIGTITRWTVLIIAGISILGMFGVQTASFAAILASAGLAVGLAFQGTLSNLAAGVMLLIFRPFKVGDVVNVSSQLGVVAEIGLFTTSLDTLDHRRIILPNSTVFGATIENITHNPTRRVDLEVGVDYSSNLDETRKVLTEAINKIANVNSAQGFDIIMSGLGASSVDWTVRIWTNTEHYWTVREDALVSIKKSLDDANIGIPFPQLDVHMQK